MCVAYRGVHGHVEARGWHGSLLKSLLTVYVDVDSLIWALSSLFSYYGSITCSRDSLGGSSESWDYRWVAMHTGIYMDAWDLNSGPQIFIASTLPTEPWHQPQLLFFFSVAKYLTRNSWRRKALFWLTVWAIVAWKPWLQTLEEAAFTARKQRDKCRYFTDFNFLLILRFQPMG